MEAYNALEHARDDLVTFKLRYQNLQQTEAASLADMEPDTHSRLDGLSLQEWRARKHVSRDVVGMKPAQLDPCLPTQEGINTTKSIAKSIFLLIVKIAKVSVSAAVIFLALIGGMGIQFFMSPMKR